jgi:N-acetylmuramoyl-L-alanine amidase
MQARRFSVVKSRWAIATAAVCLAVGLGAAAAPKADRSQPGLVRVRFGGDATATRVVIELSKSSQAKLISAGQPLVLDLPRIDVGEEREGVGQGLVKAWSADGGAGSARLKLELSRSAKIERRFLLSPSEGVPTYRYVIDLRADGAPVQPAAPLAAQMIAQAAPKLVPAKLEAKPISLKKVIVVDAGHGGHDPGALGENVQEKAVTLAAAKALKTKLESTGRYKVVLTRDDDAFIPLDNRVEIARRAGADLFISLHADAGANKSTRGASVYTLSDKGSERVQRTMASGQGGFLRVNQPGASLAVSQILLDLTQRVTRNKSTTFAQMVLTEVGDSSPLLERSHRDAAYRVLLAPDVPAVLLEMGFITNAQDEAFLSNAAHRQKLTDAVARAIDGYFSQETKLASR